MPDRSFFSLLQELHFGGSVTVKSNNKGKSGDSFPLRQKQQLNGAEISKSIKEGTLDKFLFCFFRELSFGGADTMRSINDGILKLFSSLTGVSKVIPLLLSLSTSAHYKRKIIFKNQN